LAAPGKSARSHLTEQTMHLIYISGSQLGGRSTPGCHLQCPGAPRANAFFKYIIKNTIHLQSVIKPYTQLLWVRHWAPQNIILFCRGPQAKNVGKHWSTWFGKERRTCNEKLKSNKPTKIWSMFQMQIV